MSKVVFIGIYMLALSLSQLGWAQTSGTGFTLVQEIEVGSASTGGINDALTGIDLDGDGNGEIVTQIGQSTNAKVKIFEWNGTDSYDEIWTVSLPVSNPSSDQIQRLLAVYDTDNDGNLELFVASSTTTSANARVYCYEMSDGALSSSNPSTTTKGPDGGYFQANARIRSIVTGNADNDSYGELFVGNAGNTTSLEVWEANGNDSWTKISLTGAEDDIGDGIMDMSPPTDLDNDGNDDDVAICEEQGALSVLDFSTLVDPSKITVNNKNDTGIQTTGRVVTYNLDFSGSAEIIISNNSDDGILVYEWVSGSNAYDRDKTDAVLLSIGVDIYGLGGSDYDNDGFAEIYFTYRDSIRYFEYSSSGGDFDASSDFSSSSDMITGISNDAFVFHPSANISTTLLDGDQYRDFVIGTDGNGLSGRGEIFIVESNFISIIPSTIISGTSGFRMMSSPVAGTIYSDLLSELWTQGMTGGDVTTGDPNVWTYDVSGQSWSALTNLNTASQTAGEGFLVYVYANTDNSGGDDLPVTLAVSGTENSSSATVPSSGSIADAAWALAGNPYAQTIDWDLVTQTNVTSTAYVWDNATSAYKNWNGSVGGLTDGLIAPYQGFWVKGSGGTGSITIETADKSSTAGTFYRSMNDSSGSMSFSISSDDYSDQTFVSFMTNGELGIDIADAYKLLPMTSSERVVGISYTEGNGLDINNLPSIHEGTIDIPLDIMYLTVDEDYNFITEENEVNMSWDLSSLPDHVAMTLTDNASGNVIDLSQQSEVTFTTVEKGSFPAYGSEGVNIYPQIGESTFTLTVTYGSAGVEDQPVPTEFALYPAYPNPFNPSTTIWYDLLEESHVSISIYDIKGRLIKTLVNEALPAGRHSIQWNPINISSGSYIVQMKTGDKTFNQKITYIK